MQLFHSYHHHRFDKFLPSDFWLFELSIWMHVLARSLITVFVPILMIKIGYEIGEVMFYYFTYTVFVAPLNFFAGWTTRKIGARFTIILGTIATIAFFISFSQLTPDNWPLLILLAIFAAFYDTFYWVAHLFLFIKSNQETADAGKNTGILYIVKKLGALLGPAFGALILIFSNQQILIVASIVIFILSIIPLLKVDDFKDKPETRRLPFKEFFKPLREKKNYISVALYSMHISAEYVLWPIFIFMLFGTIKSVAAVPIIVSITAMVFSYFASKVQRCDREKMIIIGSALVAIVWLLRITTDTTLLFYISVFLMGLFSLLISLPLDSNLFTRGKERDPLTASMYRNFISMLPRIILYGVLALAVNVFQVSFLVAALCMFGLMIVNYIFLTWNKKQLPAS